MTRPAPRPTPETLAYWEGAGAGELRYAYCVPCAAALFPPRRTCTSCDTPTEWRTATGQGTVHSFTRVERAPSAAFRADVPYVVALIDLDEGFRIMTNLLGEASERVRIDDRVSIVFEPLEGKPEWALPQAVLR